jgi:hypothetical protein
MIPEDSLKVFGRAGPLAHSFMLGPNGDSNGCVSFKNYDAFLQAYLDHKIKRLAVVASLQRKRDALAHHDEARSAFRYIRASLRVSIH